MLWSRLTELAIFADPLAMERLVHVCARPENVREKLRYVWRGGWQPTDYEPSVRQHCRPVNLHPEQTSATRMLAWYFNDHFFDRKSNQSSGYVLLTQHFMTILNSSLNLLSIFFTSKDFFTFFVSEMFGSLNVSFFLNFFTLFSFWNSWFFTFLVFWYQFKVPKKLP